MSAGKSLPTSGGKREFSTEGLPDDLAAVLRDQSIITPQDAKVWELLAEWADAPSDTASAMTVEEWQKAWSFAVGQMIEAAHEARRLRAENERLREAHEALAVECAGLRADRRLWFAHRDGALRALREHAASLDPESFVSEILGILSPDPPTKAEERYGVCDRCGCDNLNCICGEERGALAAVPEERE